MRTWNDNRTAINQLWPRFELTEAERQLWHDDLSGLDQDVLYDAIRNVKRNTDTLYPQLKWMRDEYKRLHRIRSFAERGPSAPKEQRQVVRINEKDNERVRRDLVKVIDSLVPAQWQEGVDLIAAKAGELKIEMQTALRLCRYLNDRLGMSDGGKIR